MNQTKICTKCFADKNVLEFGKTKDGKGGRRAHCKICAKGYNRQWREDNAEKIKVSSKKYAQTERGKSVVKTHYGIHRIRINERNRVARLTGHARNLANIARKRRYDNDPSFRLAVNARARIRKALRGIHKPAHTFELLGCTLTELKMHLETRFTKGMTWDNYSYRGWHVDHIIPCARFDLTDPKQLKICFHYTNLQPLWWRDNISKNNKYDDTINTRSINGGQTHTYEPTL